jgi:hypothetical protein
MLSGHPFSGKSTLVCGLLRSMEVGEAFLGRPTRPATALLVDEEGETLLRQRAQLFGLFDIGSDYLERSDSVRHEWPTLIEQATRAALEAGHRLLVVDTFPGLAGLREEQENDAGAIAERLRPLQKAAAAGLCVLFLHHMNSASQPRGSKAFRGIVDVSVRLINLGKSQAFRLETQSRFPTAAAPTLKAVLVRSTAGWSYRLVDQGRSASTGSVHGSTDDRLWEALVAAGSKGLTYDQLDEVEGLSKDIAKRRLPTWHQEQKVEHAGKGSKGDPFRWYVRTDG